MMRILKSTLAASLALVVSTSLPRAGASEDDYVVEYNECSGYEIDGTCYMLDSPNAVIRNEDLRGTCPVYLPIEDYLTVADAKSQYQFISFFENPIDGDRCMDLDDTVQICTNYRPHYHEPFVHFTGAYLQSMKRVVFVGGGDSMLLHEVLKYPTVELVLGLELDQKVVRHSLKHFKTQPHFDDERVQWWFGDATKSMRMLPKEYFGSFDLVLVDLSETVMSFPVTKELDIMGALALLLKPDGIFVKNELYFKKLKEIFDYTVQLWLPDNPMICDQDFVMGSNRIDFLKPTFNMLREHDVETLLLKPLDDPDDHFRLFYEYSKNDARAQGKCKDINESEDDDDDDGADKAGILLIVEAENVTAIKNKPMAELEGAFKSALEKGGLTPLSVVRTESKADGAVIAIAMREGYFIAHTWPNHNYCGFDLNLWGGFEKQEPTRDALLDVVGGSNKGMWSSYRVIVGGMIGANTWSDDKKLIGPVITQNRDCSKREPRTDEERADEATMDIALEESLKLVLDREMALVLCGEHNDTKPCSSLDVVRKSKSFAKVVALWACPSTDSSTESIVDDDDVVTNISLCDKKDVAAEIMKIAEEHDGISAIITDTSIPKNMVRNKMGWSDTIQKLASMERPFVLITPIWKKAGALKRFSLIPMMPTGFKWPLRKVSVKIENAEMHYFASGDEGFTRRLIDVVDGIKLRSGRNAEVMSIKPGLLKGFQQPDYNPHLYEPDDYDPVPGQEQFTSQRPVGYQSLIQLVVDDEKVKKSDGGGAANLSTDRVKAALSGALPQMTFEEFSDVGEGEMFMALLSDGHIVAVWDGAKHLDLNIFTYYGQVVDHKKMITERILQSLSELKVMLLDEMPRGFGRVVNFIEDIDASPDCADNYGLCKLEADNGKCSKKSEWHMTNCKKSCGLCEADLLKDKYDFPSCTDSFSACAHEWYDDDDCDDNPEFMGRYCKKTCGLCHDKDEK